mmetsp:Transcript_556/g.1138  ORF Transcript_556/g.1138 Transcript_556/m.1138 type:complete len:1039 (-) Transcript_556:148-3264(-)
MKNTPKAKSGGAGGIVIEASNRKARRKEQRNAKKKKSNHQQKTSQKGDGDKQQSRSRSNFVDNPRKKVKFSNTVEEKTIPSRKKTFTPTSLISKSRNKKLEVQPVMEGDDNVEENGRDYAKYDHLDDETAAALRKDDMEIDYLESSLGIKVKKGRGKDKTGAKKLNSEYAKNEGFGDDFGDFLLGLDDLVERCVGGNDDEDEELQDSDGEESNSQCSEGNEEEDSVSAEMEEDNWGRDEDASDNEESYDKESIDGTESDNADLRNDDKYNEYGSNEDAYKHLDEDTALALRNDDAEIAQLEEKLGLSTSSKAKKKLNKEFASSFQGYGEDFGDFLDDLDTLGERVGLGRRRNDMYDSDGSYSSSEDKSDFDKSHEAIEYSDSDSGDEHEDDAEAGGNEVDHDRAHTYQPTSGEDIYGNKIDSTSDSETKPTKYIPPHLRKKLNQDSSDGPTSVNSAERKTTNKISADPETLKLIQRSLNSSLNRLSEQTLESVSKSVASLYSQYPFHDMNDCMWNNIQLACVPPHMVMSKLIPLYIAAVSGVHFLSGDGIQLGGCLVEWSVKRLYDALSKCREGLQSDEDDEYEIINKEASNLMLIVCYMYNYNVFHCTLLYDLVRDFIENFTEVDVESLLLILSHCGQQLRSDDPSALKEIVSLVKDRAQKTTGSEMKNIANSSRIEYMVSTIIELKNNKPRKQDVIIREKTNGFKKCIGRLKSSAMSGKKGTGSCLRITLRDVLDAETKGRWWLVGASWAGNQHHKQLFDDGHHTGKPDTSTDQSEITSNSKLSKKLSNEEKLLACAASQRMNTDARRAIFCIIMGSTDCDDAFEKLVRAGMLKKKAERDVVRVLVHCCGEEKAYNPFYSFVALRVCEYQPNSRFTLMLTFWDAFKQLESYSARKVANLAKLLAHLVGAIEKCLTIGVLKRVEFSPSNMPEMTIIFLSVFMTALFESVRNTEHIQTIFSHGAPKSSQLIGSSKFQESHEDDDDNNKQTTKKEDLSDLRESISLFLLQYIKSSPKNIIGSKFNKNLTAAIEICERSD